MKLKLILTAIITVIVFSGCAFQPNTPLTVNSTICKDKIYDNKDSNLYLINYYVDEFGKKTNKGYIETSSISGLFSNSATTNSKLIVNLAVDKNYVNIFLFEYERLAVKSNENFPSSYTIRARDYGGNDYTFYGKNWSDRITLSNKDSVSFHNLLLKGKPVQVLIYNSEYSNNTYSFIIPNDESYVQAYCSLFNK